MSGFQKISRVVLPLRFVKDIYSYLRESGADGVEGVGLWLGTQNEEEFIIQASLIPAQKAYRTESGLLYHVDGEELHRINVWAYQNKLVLFAQIHSHPSEAYHSGTDDAFPMVTTLGGFSIVIPDFGFGPIDKNLWEIFRLKNNGWQLIPKEEVNKIFEIVS